MLSPLENTVSQTEMEALKKRLEKLENIIDIDHYFDHQPKLRFFQILQIYGLSVAGMAFLTAFIFLLMDGIFLSPIFTVLWKICAWMGGVWLVIGICSRIFAPSKE